MLCAQVRNLHPLSEILQSEVPTSDRISPTCTCMFALCIALQNIAVRSFHFRLHLPNLHVHVRTSHCFAKYCNPKFPLPTASPQLARACSHFALLRKILQSEVSTS